MKLPINLAMMKHPLNWVIIVAMLSLYMVGVDLVRRLNSTNGEGN